MKRFGLVLGGVLAVALGCGADDDRPADDMQGGAGAAAVQLVDAGMQEPPFEAFDIALEQSVTIGAFVLQLHSAHVEPVVAPADPLAAIVLGPRYAAIRIDFDAHNASEDLATPLADFDLDGLLLEAGGKYFFGVVHAEPVPGLRDGVGSVAWEIEEALTPDAMRSAVVTFGDAAMNQAVVEFAAPAETVTLADIPLNLQFTINNYRSTTFEVTGARVQYNSRSRNLPLHNGTALLVLEGVMSAAADGDGFSHAWTNENAFVQRPDGVSVAPEYLNEVIAAGDREDVEVAFELSQPVAGVYTFGLTGTDIAPATQQIVVP